MHNVVYHMPHHRAAFHSSRCSSRQEFHTSESAVCCMCFGDERFHKSYVLLAAGFEDGHAVLYRPTSGCGGWGARSKILMSGDHRLVLLGIALKKGEEDECQIL